MNKYLLIIIFALGMHAQLFAQLKVSTALPPVSFLIQKIGGDQVSVETALGSGQNPHTFSISPKKVSSLIASKIYFSIDFPMEKKIISVLRNSAKSIHIADISDAIKRLPQLGRHHEDHHEHMEQHGDHDDDMGDPHIWFNPQNLILLSNAILEELKKSLPQHIALLEANHKMLMADLLKLKQTVDQHLKPLKGKRILIYHPSIQYLTAQYGITLLPVEIEGKEPTAKQLGEVISQARKETARAILIDAHQDPRQIARIIELLQVKEVKLYPLNYQIVDAITQAATAISSAEGQNASNRN